MKKIILLITVAILTLSCSQAQQKEFKKEALENVMVSTTNESITFQEILKKQEGKTVVVDIWASWCSDCIAGMPKVKALQQKFPEVTYLFISMDKNYGAWLKGIEKHNLQGAHFLTSDGMKGIFGKSVELSWIPRYIVVDKTGKIALFNVIEADDEKLIEVLEKNK